MQGFFFEPALGGFGFWGFLGFFDFGVVVFCFFKKPSKYFSGRLSVRLLEQGHWDTEGCKPQSQTVWGYVQTLAPLSHGREVREFSGPRFLHLSMGLRT